MSVALALAESPANLPDIRSAEVRGRTVLVRADLDVPMEHGSITDPDRIIRLAPGVADLLRRGARVVLMGHRGSPDGVANPTLSLEPVAQRLSEELGKPVIFVPECVGAVAEQVTRTLPAASVAMLQNLRYHSGEEANDRSFALLLSVHGDYFVNDMPDSNLPPAASTAALPLLMPAFAGPLHLAARAATPLSHPTHRPEEP